MSEIENVVAQVKAVSPADVAFLTVPDMPPARLRMLVQALRAAITAAGPGLPRCVLVPGGAGVSTAKEAAAQFTRAELLAIYYDMREDAPAILASVEPGDHGDAILEAFGRRVIEAAVLRMAGAA